MKGLIPTLLCDFYKVSHREQYPKGTEVVYSTWTPRSNAHAPGIDKVVCVGVQGFIKEFLIDFFTDNFFTRYRADVINEYSRYIKYCLGVEKPYTKHIEDLYDLGYMPLKIKSLKEGTLVPFRVPMVTVENTLPEFFWVTNYIETIMSNTLWKPMTSASIARQYKIILDSYAKETSSDPSFTMFQGHDFSMRGLGGPEDSARTGFGHLAAGFVGTDTIPAIMYAENYYNSNIEKELVGTSVNATEHSVMCAGGKDDEFETYRRLIEDVYPTGIVSIVSDTWDLWHVLSNTIPKLKDSIVSRDGKVVSRPDSGNPGDIICGKSCSGNELESKGVIEVLWDIFGGIINEKGYKELDPHIGAIYGDAITLERCREICERLKMKGFASTNIVFGIGSFTYQYITRDTLGFAMKATSVVMNGEETPIFKDPKTDSGVKKSALGRVAVYGTDDGDIFYVDENPTKPAQFYKSAYLELLAGREPNFKDLLETVFEDGKILKEVSLKEIREMVSK